MDEDEATAVIWYVWSCPVCGEVQEAEPPDVEPDGSPVECRSCGKTITVHGT